MIAAVQPLHVPAYVAALSQARSAPAAKQHVAAIRHLFDWLVMGQVLPLNPAASVRGPPHSVRRGRTPVLEPTEARQLLDAIDVSTPAGLRDRALIGLMVFSFARVGAEWTARYGYKATSEYDLRSGGAFVTRANQQMRTMGLAEIIIDGEVIESDPPHKLVQTYRFLFTEQTRAEGFTRLTWEIAPTPGGFTRLTVTHDLTGAPVAAGMVTSKFSGQGGGGWNWILSDLKSLLETGANL